MRLNKLFGGVSAFIAASALASSLVCYAAVPIANANRGDDHYTTVSDIVPDGCNASDAKYVSVTFSGYSSAESCNGAIIFNTENGGWSQISWGSDDYGTHDITFSASEFADSGKVTIIREVNGAFDNPGSYCEIAMQHYWSERYPITIEKVVLLDGNKQPLAAKAAETEAPVQTDAPASTEGTAAQTTTTAAGTTKETAKPSTNPDTGDSGVALAVAAAFASAGVAVSFGRKKER